jgi:vesicular inhibitory amino acid transporter
MMILLIFTAESIPSFGRILDLIGGSTVTLMAFIMPPLFYFKLCSQTNGNWQQR